jgi:NhaP-type Na+/H+ or K+/H+ antiporter
MTFFDIKFFIGISFMFFAISAGFASKEELLDSEFEKEKKNVKNSHIFAWTGFSFVILGLCIELYKKIKSSAKGVSKSADANTKP